MWLLTVGSGNAFSVDMGTGMGEPRGSTTDAPLRPGHDGLELKQTLLNVEVWLRIYFISRGVGSLMGCLFVEQKIVAAIVF